MTISRRALSVSALGLLATTSLGSTARALDGPIVNLIEGTEEFAIAVAAYTFGYPLVTMEMTRRVLTNVPAVEATKGPMGQVIKVRRVVGAATCQEGELNRTHRDAEVKGSQFRGSAMPEDENLTRVT